MNPEDVDRLQLTIRLDPGEAERMIAEAIEKAPRLGDSAETVAARLLAAAQAVRSERDTAALVRSVLVEAVGLGIAQIRPTITPPTPI
jgi:hypothetical protein